MQCQRITLFQYRNYPKKSFDFHPGFNVLVGLNGVGKSNLLEAVNYFSIARSLRTHQTKDVIQLGQNESYIQGHFQADNNLEHDIKIQFQATGKNVLVNGKKLTRSSDLLSIFYTIYIAPEDIELVQGSPAERRRFLDIFLSKLDEEYIEVLKRYQETIKQKRKALQDHEIDKTLIELYQDQLEPLIRLIVTKRKEQILAFEAAMNDYLKRYYEDIYPVRLHYQDSLKKERLEDWTAKELKYRDCLVGPHRDDFSFELKEQNARRFMSTGEKRLLALLLKVAEKEMIKKKKGVNPVLLLDDAFLGLDQSRTIVSQELLRDALQTIITVTDESYLPEKPDKVIQLR